MKATKTTSTEYTFTLTQAEARALAGALEVYRMWYPRDNASLENAVACGILDYITPLSGGRKRQ